MTGEDRDGQAERRDLRQRKVDENDAARQHMQAEIGMDAGKDEAGDERPQQQLDHQPFNLPSEFPRAASRFPRTRRRSPVRRETALQTMLRPSPQSAAPKQDSRADRQ